MVLVVLLDLVLDRGGAFGTVAAPDTVLEEAIQLATHSRGVWGFLMRRYHGDG
jgi:hypothetical protein